jgi:hypothetical protein
MTHPYSTLGKYKDKIETAPWDEQLEDVTDWLDCFTISVMILAVLFFGGHFLYWKIGGFISCL